MVLFTVLYWYKTERQILYLLYYITKCLATHSLNLDDGTNIFFKITYVVVVFSSIRPFSNAFWCYHCHFTPFVPLFPSSLNFFVWCCKPSKRHIEPILKSSSNSIERFSELHFAFKLSTLRSVGRTFLRSFFFLWEMHDDVV